MISQSSVRVYSEKLASTEIWVISLLAFASIVRPQLLPAVVITADAQIKTAVEAIKLGAYDYMTKPLDADLIKLTLSKVAERHTLRKQNLMMQEMLSHIGIVVLGLAIS